MFLISLLANVNYNIGTSKSKLCIFKYLIMLIIKVHFIFIPIKKEFSRMKINHVVDMILCGSYHTFKILVMFSKTGFGITTDLL